MNTDPTILFVLGLAVLVMLALTGIIEHFFPETRGNPWDDR
jgi:hypothetical protein